MNLTLWNICSVPGTHGTGWNGSTGNAGSSAAVSEVALWRLDGRISVCRFLDPVTNNERETRNFAPQRDALLPKLVSRDYK
jgi:hypothetical protein